MKRLSSSESLGTMIPICPSAEEKGSSGVGNSVYNRGFQSILEGLDEEDCIEESGHITEKKRRLSVDQVKALEKNFEVENKLEPERKVKLAQELGLQPRQVAVWFQNRRARWKTKQLERDYGVLKANYDTLKANYETILRDKEALLAELRELKAKLEDEGKAEMNRPIKQEPETIQSESKTIISSEEKSKVSVLGSVEGSENTAEQNQVDHYGGGGGSSGLFVDLKDGASDSDSSAILNDENSPNTAISQMMMTGLRAFNYSASSSLSFCLPFSDSRSSANAPKSYHQFLRLEDSNFLSAEEPCDFFSEEQAPTLSWYGAEPWN